MLLLDADDAGVRHDFDATGLEGAAGFFTQIVGEGAEDIGAAFDEDDAGVGGVDVAEVVHEGVAGDLGDGSSEFDAGGAATDDDEVHPFATLLGIGLALGDLESTEDFHAHFTGVIEAFESGGVLFPLVFPEVAGDGSGGEDEIVEGEFAIGEEDFFGRKVKAGDFGHECLAVFLMAQEAAKRDRDIGGGEAAGGDLIKEGLEEVVIAPVYEGDAAGGVFELGGCLEATEATANDDEVGKLGFGHGA